MPKVFGYARVSTTDQSTAIQEAALKAAGAHVVFSERVSGTTRDNRSELAKLLAVLGTGDTDAHDPRIGVGVEILLKACERHGLRSPPVYALAHPVCPGQRDSESNATHSSVALGSCTRAENVAESCALPMATGDSLRRCLIDSFE